MREIPGLGTVFSVFESVVLYHSSYLFFLPAEDQQTVEKSRENSGMCRVKGKLMDTAFWWMKFAAVSFGEGGLLDGMKVEEKFFEGEVFSNSSDDTKLENHVFLLINAGLVCNR